MERSSSALRAVTSADFGEESGGAAKSGVPGARREMAQSVAQGMNQRFRQAGIDRFKSASLGIRRKVQRFSVRHRPWETKRRITARSGKRYYQLLDGARARRVAKKRKPGRKVPPGSLEIASMEYQM